MLFEVKNGTISLGGSEILSHFDFRMVDNEKIGIVGRNGAGKTTLLKLLNAEVELDYNDDNTKGEIVKSKDFKCGYLRQQLVGDGSEANDTVRASNASLKLTAYAYLLEAFNNLIEIEQKIEKVTADLAENYDEKKAIELNKLIDTYNYNGGNTYEKELKIGFKKFGFSEDDLQKAMDEFSGGQATKISLLKMLLSRPEVLVLDEPTNHLDIEAIEWMESYLQNYKGNIVVVSHDRMFLDNICNVIYDIENKIATRYEGNYTEFVEQKKINYDLQLATYNNNLKEIERLTALADRFRYKATKAKMVQSKDKVIEKIKEETFKPLEADMKNFHVKIIPSKQGGKEVLRCMDLGVGYDKELAKINLLVSRRDRLAVIGANGTGKSTFIKTIVGVIEKLSGEYKYGHEIEFEYFDQRIAENNSTKTLFDDFSDEFPSYDNTEVRNRLGRFLFTGEDVEKRVCDLSGGEKVRLCLSKIFERKPNLLILDEPTNHLDILGKESLEQIIESFEGTVILVSHDRYFVKKVSNKILFFEKEQNLSNVHFFEFGYEDYEKYIREKNDIVGNYIEEKQKKPVSEKGQKQKNKDDKVIKKLEKLISELEKNIDDLNAKLADTSIQSDFNELSKIQEDIDKNEQELLEKYLELETLRKM